MMRNRLYRADCKGVVDSLVREGVQVDLVYLDPPFNSNRTYSMLFSRNGVTAQQKAYHDMWDFTDSTRQLVRDFQSELEKWDLAESFRQFILLWVKMLEQSSSDEKKLLNYLMYMTQRLVLLKKVLKPTGSIYMHCDPTVSHYVKVAMDGIFGFGNFRNEIVWKRMSSHNDARRWGKIHDTLLFYTMSDTFTRTGEARIPYDDAYIARSYRHEDDRGRYMTSPLQARSLSGGGYEYEWRSIVDIWKFPKHRLDELDANGEIHWPAKAGGTPRRKVYLDLSKGVPVQDVVTDLVRKRGAADYPTKKPEALLTRIVRSSTREGHVVLDPFCGCGTAIEVAHRLKRRWIGIDRHKRPGGRRNRSAPGQTRAAPKDALRSAGGKPFDDGRIQPPQPVRKTGLADSPSQRSSQSSSKVFPILANPGIGESMATWTFTSVSARMAATGGAGLSSP